MLSNRLSVRNIITYAALAILALVALVVVLNFFPALRSLGWLLGLLKFVAAIGLLASWVVLNIPPPRPLSGKLVVVVPEFGELVAQARPAGSKETATATPLVRQVNRKVLEELNLEIELPNLDTLRNLLNRSRNHSNPVAVTATTAVAAPPTRPLKVSDTALRAAHPTPLGSAGSNSNSLPEAVEPDDAREFTLTMLARLATHFKEVEAAEAVIGRAPFVPDAAAARERARLLKANVLLWGWLEPGSKRRYFMPTLEILRPLEQELSGEREEMRLAGLRQIALSHQRAARPNTLLYLLGGLACYVNAQYPQAIGEFKMALISATMAYDEDGAALSDQAICHFYLGNSYYLMREYQAAEREFSAAIQVDQVMAEAYQNLAIVQRAIGRLDDAARNLQTAVRLSRNAVSALYNLGVVYINQNQPARARAAFQKALQATGSSTDSGVLTAAMSQQAQTRDVAAVHRGLARAFRAEKKPEQAVGELQEALRIAPDYAVLHMDLAAIYHEQREYDKAERELATLLNMAPEMAEAHYNLGLIYRSDGKIDAAADQFREATRLKPDFAEAHYDLGLLYKSQGQLDLAVRQFKEATTIQPADAESFINLGLALKDEGKLVEAAQQFRQAISLEPNNADAHFQLAAVYQTSGDTASAIDEYTAAARLNPKLNVAYHQLASLYKARKQYPEATAQLQQAIKQDRRDAYAYYLMGTLHAAQGQLDQAFEAFRIAISYQPGLSEAHYNLGVALMKRQRTEEAVKEFEEVIRLNPEDAQGHYILGLARRDLGQLPAAAAALQQAVHLNPGWADAHYNLGRVYLASNQPELAIAELLDTLQGQPENDKARYQLAAAYAAAGRIPKAIETFVELLKRDPNNAEAYYNLGIAYTGSGQYENAVRSFYSGIRLRPEDAEAYNSMGIALKTLGRLDEAISAFQQSIKINPRYAQAHYNLGQVYAAINAVNEAVEEFRKYEELGGKIGRR